ncbi:MAG TPA: ankyrin repeat domain-containing protein [Candidatus Dependentiae bacterium]|nr:ankyrin repeat domain-containing protein [Candidatus Dependentiae bacterium]HRQ62956.1 ankyrin repeat domain-containing protein [Candidatus Dependentiae bacterium]
MRFYFSFLSFFVTTMYAMNYQPISTHPPRESLFFYQSIITAFDNDQIKEQELKDIFDAAELKTLLVNTQNDAGNTLLHIAAKKGAHDFMNYLLIIGAQPRMANLEGKTPIDIINEMLQKKHVADMQGYYYCLALLTTHLEHTKQVPLCYGCWPF